jgi:hypothetical protein
MVHSHVVNTFLEFLRVHELQLQTVVSKFSTALNLIGDGDMQYSSWLHVVSEE